MLLNEAIDGILQQIDHAFSIYSTSNQDCYAYSICHTIATKGLGYCQEEIEKMPWYLALKKYCNNHEKSLDIFEGLGDAIQFICAYFSKQNPAANTLVEEAIWNRIYYHAQRISCMEN